MVKKKEEFKGKCPECGGCEFEMTAEIRATAKYSIAIVGNEIVSVDFEDVTNIEVDDIEEGTEYIECTGCRYEILIDELENNVY